jgi:hypothetical protein
MLPDPKEIIEQQRLTILFLIVGIIILGAYGILETKRERAASRTAGAFWEDLYQEREDRKLDLEYMRSLEAKIAQYEAEKHGSPTGSLPSPVRYPR